MVTVIVTYCRIGSVFVCVCDCKEKFSLLVVMKVEDILSGIFTEVDGQNLLQYIDNALVQRKKKEVSFSIASLYLTFVKHLNISSSSQNKADVIYSADILPYISSDYKSLTKNDRFIIYMDGVREYFFCHAHNIPHKKPLSKISMKPVGLVSLPKALLQNERHNERSLRNKFIRSSATVISETTDVNSTFSRFCN